MRGIETKTNRPSLDEKGKKTSTWHYRRNLQRIFSVQNRNISRRSSEGKSSRMSVCNAVGKPIGNPWTLSFFSASVPLVDALLFPCSAPDRKLLLLLHRGSDSRRGREKLDEFTIRAEYLEKDNEIQSSKENQTQIREQPWRGTRNVFAECWWNERWNANDDSSLLSALPQFSDVTSQLMHNVSIFIQLRGRLNFEAKAISKSERSKADVF